MSVCARRGNKAAAARSVGKQSQSLACSCDWGLSLCRHRSRTNPADATSPPFTPSFVALPPSETLPRPSSSSTVCAASGGGGAACGLCSSARETSGKKTRFVVGSREKNGKEGRGGGPTEVKATSLAFQARAAKAQ